MQKHSDKVLTEKYTNVFFVFSQNSHGTTPIFPLVRNVKHRCLSTAAEQITYISRNFAKQRFWTARMKMAI